MFDIEGMGALNGAVSMVELYYRLGVRQMLIAYNLNNDAGGGCHDEDKGLTDFGRAVVREMNHVGMVLDCAHSGIKSGLEAMRLSTKPCIFSHANARALHDHERNIIDEQIKAVAATGGVVGVNGLNRFLGDGTAKVESMVAWYGVVPGRVRRPPTDDIWRMQPLLCSRMSGTAARVTLTTP